MSLFRPSSLHPLLVNVAWTVPWKFCLTIDDSIARHDDISNPDSLAVASYMFAHLRIPQFSPKIQKYKAKGSYTNI